MAENKKSIIFYPPTKSGIELKESVERYLWYVYNEQVIDEVTLTYERYFDLVYPARYNNKKLYFIFDDTPCIPKESMHINDTGLLLCALYELKLHNLNELYFLNFQKEVFRLAEFPPRENEKSQSQKNPGHSTQ